LYPATTAIPAGMPNFANVWVGFNRVFKGEAGVAASRQSNAILGLWRPVELAQNLLGIRRWPELPPTGLWRIISKFCNALREHRSRARGSIWMNVGGRDHGILGK
jgi:hypothetical protein